MTEVPDEVRLGQTATVQVVVDEAEDVLAVPASAVTTAGGQTTVTVLENGAAGAPDASRSGCGATRSSRSRPASSEGEQVVRRTGDRHERRHRRAGAVPGGGGGGFGGGPGGGFGGGPR